MLRLTFLLCSCLFLLMLLGGRDFGQLRPGLAHAVVEAVPVIAMGATVETAALPSAAPIPAMPKPYLVVAAPSLPMPIVRPPVAETSVLAVAAGSSPKPQTENTVFTLSNFADPSPDVIADTSAEQPADGEIWYVSGNSLNVRSGPSTQDAVVGKLSRGEAMLVVSREGDDWARIRIEGDGVEGYVATRFLSAQAPENN